MRIWMLTAVLVLVEAAGNVDPEDPRPVIEELARRADSHERFHARYSVQHPEQGDAVLDLWYEAPDRFRMRLSCEGLEVSQWLAGSRMVFATEADGEDGSFADIRFEDLTLSGVLLHVDELFPGHPLGEDLNETFFRWRWQYDPVTDEGDLEMRVGFRYLSPLVRRFDWYPSDSVVPEVLQKEEGHVTFEAEGWSATYARETGVLTGLTLTSKAKGSVSYQLLSLDLVDPIEPRVFVVPEAPSAAAALDQRQMDAMLPPSGVRNLVLGRIDRLVAGEHLRWDRSTREDALEVLESLYEATFREHLDDVRDTGLVPWLEERLEPFYEAHDSGVSPAEIRSKAGEHRDWIASSFASYAQSLHDGLGEVQEGQSSAWPELVELDRLAFRSAVDAAVREPLLERFDAAIAEILGD